MISRDRFVKMINELQELNDIRVSINSLYEKCGNQIVHDYASGPELSALEWMVVELLEDIFNAVPKTNYEISPIANYVYDLEYGRDEGCYKDSNGKAFFTRTPDELYDFLTLGT